MVERMWERVWEWMTDLQPNSARTTEQARMQAEELARALSALKTNWAANVKLLRTSLGQEQRTWQDSLGTFTH